MSVKELMNNPDALPFSKKKQEAVMGHLLTNLQFFMLCKDRIKSDWFNHDVINQKLWVALQNFWKEYQRYPEGESEFLEFPEISCQDQLTRNRLNQQYAICVNESRFHGIDTIKPMLEEWLQTQIYMKSMSKSSIQFNKGDVHEAFKLMREGIKEIQDTKFSPDEEVDFSTWFEKANEAQGELENALTFGIDIVDKLMTPAAKKGGLLKGDTTILIAPTNVGKTTAILTIICANIKNGKYVLFFNHEGREGDIQQKLLRCMVGMTLPEYARALCDPEGFALIHEAASTLKKYLIWIPLTKPGLTIEECDSIVNRKVDEHLQRTGLPFDLFADDYPAILQTQKNEKGNMQTRHSMDLVYRYVVQWALTFKFHSLAAIQANREASKINKKLKEDETRLLTDTDVSEAYGPCMNATNILTINRDQNAMSKGVVTYLLCKSRSSETGYAIMCKSDFSRAITHSNALGGTWYRGTATMTDRIDDLLGNYNGQGVPDSVIFGSENKK